MAAEPPPFNVRKIDLHTHSTASDGKFAPAELVQRASDVGLDLIALVDHDTIGGVAEAQAAGATLGVSVIPGVEINTNLPEFIGDDGRRRSQEAHILGYYVNPDDPALLQTLANLRGAREIRAQRMVERLQSKGYNITWERVREIAKGTVGRPHIAQALIEADYATDNSDAFDRLISPKGPGFYPRYKLAPEDAIRIIRAAGGVPALAHPRWINDLEGAVLPRLVGVGLQGLECHYGEYDDGAVARLVALANQHGLVATGGSDYHGPGIHPTPLGGHRVPLEAAVRLWERHQADLAHPSEAFTLTIPAQW